MNITDKQVLDLKLYAEQYTNQDRIPRTICPVCGGGGSRELSFVLSKHNNTTYGKCYRVTCPGASIRFTETGRVLPYKQVATFKLDVFDYATEFLSGDDLQEFKDHYELTEQELLDNGVVKCPSRLSFVYPIYNLLGYQIGMLERWYGWQGLSNITRKARYYKHMDTLPLYLPSTAALDCRVAIVEDTISAIKMSRILPTVALLGTSMSMEVVNALRNVGVTDLIFMLDPDATAPVIRFIKTYSLFFRHMKAIFLDKDPKDTPFADLRYKLANI